MKKNILVILGHPSSEGLCGKLYNSYIKGVEKGGHEIRIIDLAKIEFDPILHNGYRKIQELESDLKKAQEDILWAGHLVFVFPIWWCGAPALLRGFIERVFLPGFSFKFRENSALWDKLLKGRSARLIVTMGSPSLFYRFVMRDLGIRVLKSGILKFCGVSPVRVTRIGMAEKMSSKKHDAWIEKVSKMGQKGI